MALSNNLKLLIVSCYLLVVCFHSARPQLDLSPGPQPDDVLATDESFSGPESEAPGPARFQADDVLAADESFSGPKSEAPGPDRFQVPAPSPAADAPLNYVSFAPSSFAGPPSEAPVSPGPDAPSSVSMSESDGLSNSLFKFPVDPKLKEICGSTDHPDLCLATVAPLLHGRNDVHVPSVLEMAINVSIEFAKHALAAVKDFEERASHDMIPVLKDCKDSYGDVLDNFHKAMGAFPDRDVGTMNSMLSAAITDVGDCEDAFASLGTESPLSDYADKLSNMTSNCLAIASLMHS